MSSKFRVCVRSEPLRQPGAKQRFIFIVCGGWFFNVLSYGHKALRLCISGFTVHYSVQLCGGLHLGLIEVQRQWLEGAMVSNIGALIINYQ